MVSWILSLTLVGLPAAEKIAQAKRLAEQTAIARVIDHSPNRGGVGSGVIVGGDARGVLVLTAFHVVDPGERLEMEFYLGGDKQGSSRQVRIVAFSSEADLALVHAETGYRPPRMLQMGKDVDWRTVCGPMISVGCSGGSPPTIREERLTGQTLLRRASRRAAFWLTDGEAVGGRSGGPLLDGQGRLVGVCRGGLSAGAGMAAEGLYACVSELEQFLATAPASIGHAGILTTAARMAP